MARLATQALSGSDIRARSPRHSKRGVRCLCLGVLLIHVACAANPVPRDARRIAVREFKTSVLLHGKALELHLASPATPVATRALVLYASGDGGWFGAAVDMFHDIARAGYYTVGFSSRALMRIERPRGSALSPAQLAVEYAQILAHARTALALGPSTPAVLTGWSRGAAFAVLAASASAPATRPLGVIAIGLDEGEDFTVDSEDDENDDGPGTVPAGPKPFLPYSRISELGPLPCAVIQSTHDQYLPAARARTLFGLDSPTRRFYAIYASNHRFSGGTQAFTAAFLDSLQWIVASESRTTARSGRQQPLPTAER